VRVALLNKSNCQLKRGRKDKVNWFACIICADRFNCQPYKDNRKEQKK
jgi:hypothetical protein